MENRRILRWKSFSIMRKAQIIAGVIAAFVTVVMNIPFTIDKYSPMARVVFDLGMTLAMPTWMLWRALGMGGGPILFAVAETIINSILSVITVTVIGGIVGEITKPLRRNRP